VMRLKWKLIWVYLEIVLILKKDRCPACAECNIRLKNHFGRTSLEHLGNVGHVEACLGPFGDSANLNVI
jgi:hypothetical protein